MRAHDDDIERYAGSPTNETVHRGSDRPCMTSFRVANGGTIGAQETKTFEFVRLSPLRPACPERAPRRKWLRNIDQPLRVRSEASRFNRRPERHVKPIEA